jgi:hypothetical protein
VKELKTNYVGITDTQNILHYDADQNSDTGEEVKNISAKLCEL